MKIALLGAECTGKSTLAQALAEALQKPGRSVAVVPEALRQWCDEHGRTPQAHEQFGIAQQQSAAVVACTADIVISDTTALMTAIYSQVLFDDASLLPYAVEQQRRFDVTLVCGLDVPWVADGFQRDGMAVRARVDARLRAVLAEHRLPYAMIYGTGEKRTACALQPLLHRLGEMPLNPDEASAFASWKWNCEKCSDPECEHRLFTRLTQPGN